MHRLINSIDEYLDMVKEGFHPLIDLAFTMPISLRVEIQDTAFGDKKPKNDLRFYKWIWDRVEHICEETGTEIHVFRSIHFSHIISKGSHPEMRYDPRNINLVLGSIHDIWEYGGENGRRKLRIYEMNEQRIELLRGEYNQLNQYPKWGTDKSRGEDPDQQKGGGSYLDADGDDCS